MLAAVKVEVVLTFTGAETEPTLTRSDTRPAAHTLQNTGCRLVSH